MNRVPDLFANLKPPRARPRQLMHVCDVDDACSEDGPGAVVRMRCARCGHETEWLTFATITEAKRGQPCPACYCVGNAR